jgi:hypothetical protein
MDWRVDKGNPDSERRQLNRILQEIAAGGGGGGTVDSVVAGTGIDVDATDPANPEVALQPSVVTSLGLADTSVQPGDNISVLTNDEGFLDQAAADALYDPLGAAATAEADANTYTDTQIATRQPLDAQLTSLAGLSYAGNALKVVRVNAGENNFELATVSSGGGQVDSVVAGAGIDVDATDPVNPIVELDAASIASLGLADTALQPGDPATDISYDDAAVVNFGPVANVQEAIDAIDAVLTDVYVDISGKQPLDSDLTAIAGLAPSDDDVIQRKAGVWTNRTMAQLKVDLSLSGTNTGDQTSIVGITGTKAQFDTAVTDGNFAYQSDLAGYQPLDATLTALAGANWAANALPIGTGADALSQTTFAANTFPARASTGNLVAKSITDFGLSLVDDASAGAARTTLGATTIGGNLFTLANPGAITFPRYNADNSVSALSDSAFRTAIGLGTAATQNTGTSGANLVFASGNNVYSGTTTFTGTFTIDKVGAATTGQLGINVDAGQLGRILYNTAGLARWELGKDTTAESGANAGSNWRLRAYDDAGAALGNVYTAERSTRILTFAVSPKAPTPATATSDTTVATTAHVHAVLAAAGGSIADVQAFTVAGGHTWTKPSGCTFVEVICYGGGGGGGGGASLATAAVAKGGAGGGGGSVTRKIYRASDLGATEAVTVGAAGTAGAAGAAGAAGGDGGVGGTSTFGTTVLQRAYGGGGGRGGATSAVVSAGGGGAGTGSAGVTGTATSGAGGGPGTANTTDGATGGQGAPSGTTATGLRYAEYGGAGGGGSTTTYPGGSSLFGGGAGGAGGCHTNAPAVTQPSAGGESGSLTAGAAANAGTSGAVPTVGGAGLAGIPGRGGGGGGGGGSTVAAGVAGAAGGAGGLGGGGGGGGGVGMNPGVGGAGGAGGSGAVYVFSW